jgi:hypothetical protein
MTTHVEEEPKAQIEEDSRDREEVDDPAVAACLRAENDAEERGQRPIPWAEARNALAWGAVNNTATALQCAPAADSRASVAE